MTVRHLLAALALAATPAAAQQRSLAIERFDARIRVERDSRIDVTETITVRFNGSWNGLYRTVPVKYRTSRGLNWTLGLDLIDARDQDGQSLRVESSRERHYLKYKIWVPGAQDAVRVITLHYRATNGLRFFEEHDELYWNITGDEWDVPIQAASAAITLPDGATGVRAIAFTGEYGSTAQDAAVDVRGTTIRITRSSPLGFHEGVTAVVGWDKGLVTEPTAADRAAGVAASNWPLVIPIPVFLLAFAVWRRRGRDPRLRPIAAQYEPPDGLTPGEAGTMLDESADLRDVTATLVDLAVRGYLRFEERDDRKLFGLIGGREYVLHRLKDDWKELALHERYLLAGVFGGRGVEVKLSDLEDEFYESLPGIKDGIFDRLLTKGFYRARPDTVRTRWRVGAVLAGMLIGGTGAGVANLWSLTPVPFVIAAILVFFILLAFAAIMPARTEAGTRALEQVLGFEEFLRRVDSDLYKRVVVGHPEMFDKFLPYAMAFGVEKKWARAFEDIYTQPPTWYVGPSMTHFSVGHLSNSLNTFTSRAGSTMTSSPRSSSGSGFGGGGSSGGGGGGGGGGGF